MAKIGRTAGLGNRAAIAPGSERDRHAFEHEMLPHLGAAYRLAWALTGHREDAEDLVQEGMLRAFSGFSRYERGSNARAWLLTIVRNAYLNARRKARARPLLTPLAGPDERLEPVDLSAADPEQEAVRSEEQQVVLTALAAMPEPSRAVLALVDLEGLRYAEAAEILGCPIGTVMSRLHRGRIELAERLRGLVGEAARYS